MQKPTKAFADMTDEVADKLEGVLTEMYPAGNNQADIVVSVNMLRANAADYRRQAEQDAQLGTVAIKDGWPVKRCTDRNGAITWVRMILPPVGPDGAYEPRDVAYEADSWPIVYDPAAKPAHDGPKGARE